jgi:CRP-like cAMP-binding protein
MAGSIGPRIEVADQAGDDLGSRPTTLAHMSFLNQAALSRFLKRLLLRSDLGPEEQNAILSLKGHAVEVKARADLILPGQTVTYASLIVDGLVARFDTMGDSERQITSFHLPGDMCDLVTCPSAGRGMMAISTSRVLHVPHAELLAMATKHPTIALAFWHDTIADASVLAKWVANLGRKNARARLAHLLCEIGIRMEHAGLGTRDKFHFAATQEQIAEATGMTTVNIHRVLKPLRAANLVVLGSGKVEIPNWRALAAIAEFDSAYLLLPPKHRAASLADRQPFAFQL